MKVGIIGLGIMGSAYAKNLRGAGIDVVGTDPVETKRQAIEAEGATVHAELGPWVAECDVVVLALISPEVLTEVSGALAGLLRSGQVVLETGTFALDDKMAARETIERSGAVLLDCPVSGTGAQAARADLVMMASGPEDALERARPMIEPFTRVLIHAGAFGDGTKLKFVANHAVALHNAAAAETLAYARALKLDPDTVYEMLSGGAGQSKMSDLRMPLMIRRDYEPATASMRMFKKDLAVIGADIAEKGVTAPIYEVVRGLYDRAFETIPDDYDTAAVYEVYDRAD